MSAGDGKFFNHSCDPNIFFHSTFYRYGVTAVVDRTSPQASVISLLKPLRYVSHTERSIVMRRHIGMDEELTLFYNCPPDNRLSVTEIIGGSFPIYKCYCGSYFCAGAMLRRLRTGSAMPSDSYFFKLVQVNATRELRIDLELLKKANTSYRTSRATPQDTEMDRVRTILTADPTATPMDLDTLRAAHDRALIARRVIPQYLLDKLRVPANDQEMSAQ